MEIEKYLMEHYHGLISILNRTNEVINCYIFTANLTRLNPEFTAIDQKQVDFLDEVVKKKNKNNIVQKVDVTRNL